MKVTASRSSARAYDRGVKLIVLAIVVCSWSVAGAKLRPHEADAPAGPTWVSGPDKAYNCTHYLDVPTGWKAAPQVSAGQAMKLVMRRDKDMKFTLVARSSTKKKSKVTFELENAPPGAKLAGAKFTWKVAGTAGQKLDFALVAVGVDGGRTRWPISVTIADDKLVTAWSAGLGSVWPDCNVYAPMQPELVADMDGDGKDDVIYRTYAGEDGTTEAHVMLQRGSMKFVEVHSCYSCGPSPDVAVDGTRLLVLQDSCCCIESGSIYRFDGDSVVSVGSWQESSKGGCNPDPDGGTTIVFDRDAKGRIEAVEMHPEKGKVRRYPWKGKQFDGL